MSRKPHYNHMWETLTPTPPPPKPWTTPAYQLERFTLRCNGKTVEVQLHGLRGSEKRTESIRFPLLPHVADVELVRAAVFFSPQKWTVPFEMNANQFHGKFASPLDGHLLAALMRAPQTSSPGTYHQTPLLPDAAPTGANTTDAQPRNQSIPQPGQFQSPLANTPQPTTRTSGNRRGVWQWYKTRTRKMQVSLGCATVLAVVLFCSLVSAARGNGNIAPPMATPTPAQQAALTSAKPALLPTPTQPAPKPTARPTPPVIVRPTPLPPKPTPPPSCQAVSGNPWCYNFVPGNLIYNPPANFCDYFACLGNFWDGNGYVVECQDSRYSLSGGMQGACAHHRGVLRPLYAHE